MPNFDDWNMNHPNNPAYQKDEPKEPEMFKCGLCDDKFDHELDLWNTGYGEVLVCAQCFNYNSQEETKLLIELIKCAK